jgi:hypothetical protein
MLRPLRSLAIPAALALSAALAACGDAPTTPTSFAREAGGRTWVAVAEPAGLPEARTWLPYLSPDAAGRVRAMVADARTARRAGKLEEALQAEAQARMAAATLVTAPPSAGRLRAGIAALEEWEARAAERRASASYPGLDSLAAVVAERRAAAQAALAAGDARGAALRLAEGAEAARAASPTVVALRLVADAERRIDGDPAPSAELRRARLLLRLSREAMATGDQTRAMKRAWYALQLIDADAAARAR